MKFADASGRGVGESYIPSCQLNAVLQKKYGTTDTHAFRYYLQQNGEQVMKDLQLADESTCKTCPVCAASLSYKPSGNLESKQ